MRVIILGAGEVGWFLTERLLAEHHDVVVVELDEGRARAISEQLDAQVVIGSGSSPSVLHDAGIHKADLLAAVTQNDETNLIASLLAKQHGVEISVVRLQAEELRGPAGENLHRSVGADLVIDPDADTADEILELMHVTGADEVYPMAGGDLVVIGAVIPDDAPIVGRNLAEIASSFGPEWPFLFGAVTRDGVTTIPRGDQYLEAGDHVRVLATRQSRRDTLQLLGLPGTNAQRVMVLGGGAIGTRVAEELVNEGVDIVIIERDPKRARELAAHLRHAVVVVGEITNTDLLAEEAVGQMDAVIGATGDDSSNVLACAFAAAEGAKFTVSVLHRLSLLPLIRRFGINAALSPRTASANAVLRHVRGGTAAVTTFLESDAEVDELEIEPGSRAAGAVVSELKIPHNILLGAVVRPGQPGAIVRGDTVLQAGDHIVVFATPDALAEARPLFVDPIEK